jgi:two-component system, chemotaxis family, sensor kinase Cph1
MTEKERAKTDGLRALRGKAETRLNKKVVRLREQASGDLERVVHELQVHQIELEMQNEDLRRMRQELEASRQKYADLYDFAPVGYFTFDRYGHVVEANLAGCWMLGIERSKLMKKPFHAFVAKDSQDQFYLHRQAALVPGAKQTCEITLVRKDGGLLEARLDSVPIQNEGEHVIGIRVAVIDITERKQVDEARRQSEQREREHAQELAIVLESIPTPVVIVHDADSRRMTGNRAAEELLRLPPGGEMSLSASEEFRPRHFKAIKDGRELRPDELPAQRAARGEHVRDFEFDIVFNDGVIRTVLGYGTPLRDDKGKPRGAVHVLVDITERKRAEEQLKRLTEQLERSNKALDEFANIVSHDLREPLRAVAGFIELLGKRYKDRLDDKAGEYIQFAVNGANRMNDLLTGLLECSRVQTRGEVPTLIPAQAALRVAIENLQNKIAASQAVITSDELPEVRADGRQLTQVFQNLIDNAIKFRDEQRPEIHVGCRQQQDRWQFSVRDNGIGIDPQFQERIFKIFQRLHTQEEFPGYGVGLTICQKIVQRHGGRIWVESQEGEGSTFYFTI